jgi:saccharopine dehydrogenase-like NADP-dependent oxidoreductase
MKILVVGGTGAVGRHICGEVVRTLGPEALVVGDYRLVRGWAFARSISKSTGATEIDIRDRRSVERATENVDAVIVAVRQGEPVVQSVCTERGIHSVDIVPDTPLARSVFPSDHERDDGGPDGRHLSQVVEVGQNLSGVVAAGLIPGLSGLMARHVIERSSRSQPEVHVALLQRKNGTAGAAGIGDMLGLFARPVEYQGRRRRGFSVRRTVPFPPPFGNRSVRLVAFPEAADLRAAFGLRNVSYWTAFDNEGFNRTISTLNAFGILNRFRAPGEGHGLARLLARTKMTPNEAGEEVALAVEAGETWVRLTVPSDYGGTAMAAVAMTRALVVRGAPEYGVVMPFQIFSMEEIVERIDSPDVRISQTREVIGNQETDAGTGTPTTLS